MDEPAARTNGSAPKLRTARDVWNRLRHDERFFQNDIRIGYRDTIVGPLEIGLHDFLSSSEGGDVPEHRIVYFRRRLGMNVNGNITAQEEEEKECGVIDILWDRLGRVDKIFGSGRGNEAPISAETMEMARQAIINTRELRYRLTIFCTDFYINE
jgi:MJ1316 RNA cyclic group end recognition domain